MAYPFCPGCKAVGTTLGEGCAGWWKRCGNCRIDYSNEGWWHHKDEWDVRYHRPPKPGEVPRLIVTDPAKLPSDELIAWAHRFDPPLPKEPFVDPTGKPWALPYAARPTPELTAEKRAKHCVVDVPQTPHPIMDMGMVVQAIKDAEHTAMLTTFEWAEKLAMDPQVRGDAWKYRNPTHQTALNIAAAIRAARKG